MTWQLRVPFRSREDPLADVGFAARHLDDEEDAAVVRQLTLDAVLAGHRTAGDLIDNLDRLSPAERRRVLDKAREGAGFEATEMIDAREVAAASATLPGSDQPLRDPNGRVQALCAVKGCGNSQLDPVSGQIAWVPVRRWHCPEHRGQAAPGDTAPYGGPRWVFGPGGGLINLDEQETERQKEAEREKSRLAQRQAREAEQRAAAAQAEEDRRAEREALDREIPDGVPRPW